MTTIENIDQDPHIRTPLVEVTDKLPFKPPCRIFFKNELEQPSGSFKIRGIGYMIKKNVALARSNYPGKEIHIFASSGGNAGLSAAYSAQRYNVKCTVAVPNHTKPYIIKKLQQYNANVIVFGNSINEADKFLKTKMLSIDDTVEKIYCHPFENELIWQGHATMVDEIVDQLPNPQKLKGLVCSIGGGGLYNGLMQGLINHDLETDILLIETNQAPTFKETIKRKEIFTLDSVKSVASSLACSFLSKQSLTYYLNQDTQRQKTKYESIDDLDTIKALVDHYNLFHQIVEPACGAALSVVYKQLPLLYKNFSVAPDDIIVIVVCGGSCTNESDLQQFIQMTTKSKF